MRTLVLLAALALATPAAAQDAAQPSCATNCHGNERTAFASSVHAGVLGCVDCHGGDPTAYRDKERSHSAAAGFRGKPARKSIPELCGSCHSDPVRMFAYHVQTDQLAAYRTSEHGKALFERGDEHVAVCSDCHGAHGVLRVDDPSAPTARANVPDTCGRCHADPALMAPYKLPTDIVAQFKSSVHGRALEEERTRGAPTCTDCHGSHGAAPPGLGTTAQVCSNCHTNTGEWYRKSPHAGKEPMTCAQCHVGEPAALRSDCATCHDAHAIAQPGPALFSGTEPGHCGHCHRDPDKSAEVSAAILSGTARLAAAMDETQRLVADAKEHGLFLENEQVYLRESERTLVAVKPIAHSLDVAAVNACLQDGIKRQDATRERLDRKRIVLRDRKLLVGGVVLVLLMLAGLLAVKLDAVRRLS